MIVVTELDKGLTLASIRWFELFHGLHCTDESLNYGPGLEVIHPGTAEAL
jgi:hypothetical protein